MVDFARANNVTLQVVALDASPAILEIARRRSPGYHEINFVEGNALTYGGSGEFDFVHCSLALHHFSDDDAVRMLTRGRLLSARWTLFSDLERSVLTTLGVWLLTGLIYRNPMTRHDGRLSAKRAFSFGEMRALAESAGWVGFSHTRFAFCRQAVWVDCAAETEDICLPAEACPG
jgi:SAM-dependent methyltransferase